MAFAMRYTELNVAMVKPGLSIDCKGQVEPEIRPKETHAKGENLGESAKM